MRMAIGVALLAALGCRVEKESGPPPPVPPATPTGFHVGYRVLDVPSPAGTGDLTVAVWYPTAARPAPHVYGGPTRGEVAVDAPPLPGPFPLLAFSHGYGGSGLSAVFLTEALASRGWVVAAPDHHDRHSAGRIRGGAVEEFDRLGFLRHARQIASSRPGERNAYAYRLDELRLAIDGVLADPRVGPVVDRARIAAGGHSFGGFTALGLAGTIPERHDPRIRALLIFSSGAAGYLFEPDELARVKVPSIYLYGEKERDERRGDRTMLQIADALYASLPAPKHLAEVAGATHFSFNGRLSDALGARLLSGSADEHAVIRHYAVTFLEAYVAGRGDPDGVLAARDPRLSRYIREAAAKPSTE